MKKIVVFTILLMFSVLNLLILPAISGTPDETHVAGTIHVGSIPSAPQPPGSTQQMGPLPNETGYWLRLDNPVYVLKGSKSEASTDIVVLSMPENLQKKTVKFDGKRVAVTGKINCTGNWREGAYCHMLVKQIDMTE
jgi:hypothetical protein